MKDFGFEIQDRQLLMAQDQLAQTKLRYADLFDFAPIGYCTLDENGIIEEINLAGARLLGGTPRQFIRHRFDESLVDEGKQEFHNHLMRGRDSGQRLRTELQVVPKDSEPIVVELYTIATREMEFGRIQSRCAIINITERRRAEEELKRSYVELELRSKHHFLSEASAAFSASLRYETVLENIVRMSIPRLADCCVIDMVQPDESLIRSAVAHLDKSKERLLWELGKLPEDSNEAFGKSKVIRTARPELYAEVSESLLTALAGSAEHLTMLKDLDCRSYLCVPLNVRGRAIGAIGFMRVKNDHRYSLSDLAVAEEFTERAAMALDNATLYSKEQAANQLKDEFMAMVSHELKTPLTPILGAIYRLRLIRPDDPDVQRMADIVERNARRQTLLIDDLLDVSRVTTGRFQLNKKIVDLTQLIASAVETARSAGAKSGVAVEGSIQTTRPILCDPERMQQAVSNLVTNAIKFSRSGGLVQVNVENEPSLIRISVTDQGEGIAPDFLPFVFEPFRQADHFNTRSHSGLGLGLSIVHHIVREHGGTVRAESQGKDKGAKFTVELPYFPETERP